MGNLYKYSLALVYLLSIFFLSSCDSFLGLNIREESQIKKFEEKIGKFVTPEMAVSEIMFFRADERAQDIMGTVSISYYISNPNQSQKMVIDLNSWKIIKDEKIKSKETALGVPIHQIEFLVISGIIEKATKELESNNMKYAGIKQFYILPENGKPTYKFTLDGQPNNTSITTKGKYMAIHYQEVHFNVDSTGNQEIQIDKKLRKKRSGLK